MAKTKTIPAEVEESEGQYSAKEAAQLLGTDPRSLRKFMRGKQGLVGQGNRWTFDDEDIEELRKHFKGESTAKVKTKPKKGKKDITFKVGKAARPDEPEELEDMLPPTDDELEDIEEELDDDDFELDDEL